MKTIKIALLLFIAVSCVVPLTETKAQMVSVNFSLFQNELSPYGRWVNNPKYGQVWIYRDAGFRPYYSNGHWEYTNYGWAWISDFDWGWAPFHYGRWEYDSFDGWMWIPDYTWGPAWVSWSNYGDYYGWAPLGYGYNIYSSFNSFPYNYWTFIPKRNICDRDINRYYIAPEKNNNFRNAVVINNYYDGKFTKGPERKDVERFTRNTITERRIEESDRTALLTNRKNNLTTERRNTERINTIEEQTQAPVNNTPTPNREIKKPIEKRVITERQEQTIENNRSQNLPQRQKQIERPVTPQRTERVIEPVNRSQNVQQRQPQIERPVTPQRTEPVNHSQNIQQRQPQMERPVMPQRNVERPFTPSNNVERQRPSNNGSIQRSGQAPVRRTN